MKRKQRDEGLITDSATPKKRRAITSNSDHARNGELDSSQDADQTPKSTRSKTTRKKIVSDIERPEAARNGFHEDASDEESGSPTPKANGNILFHTPKKASSRVKQSATTPSYTSRADRSAKRKSASALLEREDQEDWEGENALAQEILEDEDDEDATGAVEVEELVNGAEPDNETSQAETPSKRGRGRPKGSKNRRSPTPEGDIAPEERYFFQNRSGPPHVSNNSLSSLKLLTHDEYFEQMRGYKDHHEPEKRYLMKLHARSFPQWRFELSEGFNICLYGWGSKRQLVNKFAEWLYPKYTPQRKIVVVNGYIPKLNIRAVMNTLSTAVMGDEAPTRLVGQPGELLDTILSYLTAHPPPYPIIVMINSIDASSLRRPPTQSLFSKLAAHLHINLVATADTPSFPLLWNTTLRDQFNFVFHDCTTYAPYEVEINVVDDVHELLGRKGRRMGGKEGVGFVLNSLPENARNLYRVLLTEILAILGEGMEVDRGEAYENDEDTMPGLKKGLEADDQVGIDHRLLYQKASEEFICSSEMNFRTLLKEFHDHEMIVSRRDAGGAEILGVPLGREEMEGVLEDLVVG